MGFERLRYVGGISELERVENQFFNSGIIPRNVGRALHRSYGHRASLTRRPRLPLLTVADETQLDNDLGQPVRRHVQRIGAFQVPTNLGIVRGCKVAFTVLEKRGPILPRHRKSARKAEDQQEKDLPFVLS